MSEKNLVALVRAQRDLPAPEQRRRLRVQANISLQALGSQLSPPVTAATVWHWEKGTRRPTGVRLLQYVQLLQALQRELVA
jgi:DNA-binding transcriptional regulator YiaG